MQFQNERQVADRAQAILGRKLHSRVEAFKQHSSGNNSVQKVETVSAVRRYTKDGNTRYYMNSLSIKMGKHGFVQNFGVDGQRKGGTRKRKKPHSLSYNFKAHYFKLKKTPFINESIAQSGVIDFVLENIMKLRTEGFLIETRNILQNRT